MWYNMLKEMDGWKVIELKTGKDKTNMFSFISGWQTTMRSLMFVWNRLKKVGFKFLSMRAFNQDPLENTFCCVRQHGIANTNPTCFQFMAALKTVIVNNIAVSVNSIGNCEDDNCTPLSNLRQFLQPKTAVESEEHEVVSEEGSFYTFVAHYSSKPALPNDESDDHIRNDNQALAYVSGFILNQLGVTGETDCEECKTSLFSTNITEDHLFTSFKENDTMSPHLQYASANFMTFLNNAHEQLYSFLNQHGHRDKLVDKFCSQFNSPEGVSFCTVHFSQEIVVLKTCVPFLMYKYVRDCKDSIQNKRRFSKGHDEKVKKFKKM